MEPFGLFDLLKTLLPPTQNQEETEPTPHPQSVQTQQTKSPPLPLQETENACWAFMQQHDKRAKNAKKRPD